jgi:uncharacterized PurR-regulated membrane protein YhhQ (DUF165 family)
MMIEVALYLGSIMLANVLVHHFGLVSFLGLVFPAGAVVVGLTFSFRDMLQVKFGKWQCWIWMFVAGVITFLFNKHLAIASISAFLVSEAVDWTVFTLVPGSFRKRMIWSNIAGLPLDSFVFVWLAFGVNWQAVFGQSIVKVASSMLVLFMISWWSRRVDMEKGIA